MIEAPVSQVGRGVVIAGASRIHAREAIIGDNVVIEDDVTISCDHLEIGAGCRINAGCRIISPEVRLGESCVIGAGLEAEMNAYFRIGQRADIGRGVRMTGQGVDAGDHLWCTDLVLIGGGGARGPRAYLTIGDRAAIMDRCFINVSEPVTIGSDTALSVGVTILTHSLWQPVLTGGTTVFASTRVGSRNILYVNAIIAPGVTTGDDVTVAAGAVVLHDVPDGATAVGNPARIIKSTPAVPRELEPARKDELVRDALRTYADSLPVKSAQVEIADDPDVMVVRLGGRQETIRYIALQDPNPGSADITLAFGDGGGSAGRCHFDLTSNAMSGTPSPISEDLRDHLRRRTIRIFTDQPFRPLPPANIARLKDRLRT